jgi:hypothetical protein
MIKINLSNVRGYKKPVQENKKPFTDHMWEFFLGWIIDKYQKRQKEEQKETRDIEFRIGKNNYKRYSKL